MEKCKHSETEYCPISKTHCPGFCVFADIMENVSLGILVFDLSNRMLLFQNQSARDIFNTIKPGDFEALCSLLIPDINNFLEANSPYPAEQLNFGNKVLGYTAYKISERFVWVFIRDITDKVRLESIAEAVNTMNNIGYIFSGIRHEIGNPINSVKMAMSVLKNNIDNYSKATILDYVNRTLEDISRIEYLLKSLRNFNMFEHPDIQKTHMPSFLERFRQLISSDFEKNGIEIIINLDPETEWAYTDSRALQQVLLNVIANAADALEEQENPAITITVNPAGDRALLTVTDNGCGISPEKQKEIFKPFFTDKPNGTGLGLMLTRKMLSRMACSIDIESEEHVGTTVKITIPRTENWELIPYEGLY